MHLTGLVIVIKVVFSVVFLAVFVSFILYLDPFAENFADLPRGAFASFLSLFRVTLLL